MGHTSLRKNGSSHTESDSSFSLISKVTLDGVMTTLECVTTEQSGKGIGFVSGSHFPGDEIGMIPIGEGGKVSTSSSSNEHT